MRKLITLGTLTAMIYGCQTTASVMKEPDRSGFYYSCMSSNLHVTTCACIEQALVSVGVTSDADLTDTTKAEAGSKAVQASLKECVAKTQKLLDDAAE